MRLVLLCGRNGFFALGLALSLAFAAGCASNKSRTRPTAREPGRAGATNRFDSSIATEAQTTAKTNAAPTKAPDNTAQNKTEKADTLTPLDQGNSAGDRRITQDLRKSIVMGRDGKRFSFNAKNIKIITINGEVTLRGVVANDAEKAAIQSMAQGLAGVRKVNNQLNVKRAAK